MAFGVVGEHPIGIRAKPDVMSAMDAVHLFAQVSGATATHYLIVLVIVSLAFRIFAFITRHL